MEINQYFNLKKELQNHLLRFIGGESKDSKEDKQIFNVLEIQKFRDIKESKVELQELLNLIVKISNNHRRNSTFFNKIEQILLHFQKDIQTNFTNSEIFNIFQSSKRILLFLFENKLLNADESIFEFIEQKSEMNNSNYLHYFYPEIKSFLDEERKAKIEHELPEHDHKKFEEKRKTGENESELCQLIRNDSVDKFISYINQIKPSLLSTIKPSIFETNSFLMNKEPTIIEYASFYGSVKIFQYLQFQNIKLTSSLWFYSIHGESLEIINILEENHVIPEDASYEKCFEESIKCHHNEIAKRFKANYIDKDIHPVEDINSYGFRHCNYDFINTEISDKSILFYACEFNYIKLVELLLNSKKLNLNEKIVLKLSYCNRVFKKYSFVLSNFKQLLFINGVQKSFLNNVY